MRPMTCALTVPFLSGMPQYELTEGVQFCIYAEKDGTLLCTPPGYFKEPMNDQPMAANTQLTFTPCLPGDVQISFWVNGTNKGDAVGRSIHIKSSGPFLPIGGPSKLTLLLAAAGALVVAAIVVIALDKD